MTLASYRHSGKAPIAGLLLAMLMGAGAAAVLGIGYSFGIVYIASPKINSVLTLLFAALVAVTVSPGVRIGHVRNRFWAVAITVVSAFVGLYMAWGADYLARNLSQHLGVPGGDIVYAFRPMPLLHYAHEFYQKGFWSWNHGQGNIEHFSGVQLGLVWIAEAVIVAGFAALLTWFGLRWDVYCESCERWMTIHKDVKRLAAADSARAAEQIAVGNLKALATASPAAPNAADFFQMNLARCETCGAGFVSIEHTTTTLDKKGKPQKKTKSVLNWQSMAPADVSRLRKPG